jgi:hypothetical protein
LASSRGALDGNNNNKYSNIDAITDAIGNRYIFLSAITSTAADASRNRAAKDDHDDVTRIQTVTKPTLKAKYNNLDRLTKAQLIEMAQKQQSLVVIRAIMSLIRIQLILIKPLEQPVVPC